MPQIKDYSAPGSIGINPTDRGTDAAAGTARRVGSFFNQVGGATQDLGSKTAQLGNTEAAKFAALGRDASTSIQAGGDAVVKYVDQKDHSDVSLAASGMLAGLDKDWAETSKGVDPRDGSIAQKFMEEKVGPELEKLQGIAVGENGQKFADSKVDQLRSHFSAKIAADMATRAGDAAILNDRQTTNNLSNAVTTSPDFKSVDMALQMHKEAAAGLLSNSNISGVQAEKLNVHFQQSQEQIVHSAAVAAITKASDPEAAAAAFSKRYPDYIKGDQVNQLAKAASVQNKANEWTQTELRNSQRREIETKAAAELSDNWTKNVTYDEAGQVHVNPRAMQNILDIEKKYPGAATADSQKMIGFLQAQQREKREVVNSDQATRGDLITRFSSPDNFPTEIEILRAQAEHKLSSQDAREMLALQKAIVQRPGGDALKRDHAEFFKQYGPTIDPEMKLGNPTPLGAQNLYRAQMDAYRQEEALRAKGLDPHLVYDPRSEYFFGNPKNIGSYRPTMQDQANYKAQLATDKARTAPARNDTMPAIPAPEQRAANTTYDTPKGPMKWTGTGWVKP